MSANRFSLDSNILIYAFDFRDALKQSVAEQIVRQAAGRDCMLGLQTVGEFYTVSTRKKILPRADAGREALNYLAVFPTFPASIAAHRSAANAAPAGRFSYWDAVLVASAIEAGCTLFLSEDMHDGMTVGPLTIRNPFGPSGLSAAATAALAP
jgi:predicted nucleic acid-binding protein